MKTTPADRHRFLLRLHLHRYNQVLPAAASMSRNLPTSAEPESCMSNGRYDRQVLQTPTPLLRPFEARLEQYPDSSLREHKTENSEADMFPTSTSRLALPISPQSHHHAIRSDPVQSRFAPCRKSISRPVSFSASAFPLAFHAGQRYSSTGIGCGLPSISLSSSSALATDMVTP